MRALDLFSWQFFNSRKWKMQKFSFALLGTFNSLWVDYFTRPREHEKEEMWIIFRCILFHIHSVEDVWRCHSICYAISIHINVRNLSLCSPNGRKFQVHPNSQSPLITLQLTFNLYCLESQRMMKSQVVTQISHNHLLHIQFMLSICNAENVVWSCFYMRLVETISLSLSLWIHLDFFFYVVFCLFGILLLSSRRINFCTLLLILKFKYLYLPDRKKTVLFQMALEQMQWSIFDIYIYPLRSCTLLVSLSRIFFPQDYYKMVLMSWMLKDSGLHFFHLMTLNL